MGRNPVLACAVGVLLAAGASCKKETVTAPSLAATCEAHPASGAAPLAVSFVLGVSGAEGTFNVAVSYGDGGNGTSADAPHTYTTPGTFAAAFTVTTATQSARCSTVVTVGPAPTPPPNQPVNAVFKSDPKAVGDKITGKAPLTVLFNMCASWDPERDPVLYRMDFDGDGHFDIQGTTGAFCRRAHDYAAGAWTAVNCLHDSDAEGKPLHEDQCKTYTVVATP